MSQELNINNYMQGTNSCIDSFREKRRSLINIVKPAPIETYQRPPHSSLSYINKTIAPYDGIPEVIDDIETVE